jgi:hypothetical protein
MSSGPPPGIDLNADIKQTVISPVIALMILAAASVALRIVSKLSSKMTPQLDDYFILAALVSVFLELDISTANVPLKRSLHGALAHLLLWPVIKG